MRKTTWVYVLLLAMAVGFALWVKYLVESPQQPYNAAVADKPCPGNPPVNPKAIYVDGCVMPKESRPPIPTLTTPPGQVCMVGPIEQNLRAEAEGKIVLDGRLYCYDQAAVRDFRECLNRGNPLCPPPKEMLPAQLKESRPVGSPGR
jgi:hypothetical protein